MDALQQLSTPDLVVLAAALRAGRLMEPYTEVALRRHCGGAAVPSVAAVMSKLAGEGMQGNHLASLLEAVVQARKSQRPPTEIVELVWSGPETVGITNRDTGVVVRELFGTATTEVLIAGFAVYQGHSVFRRLAERMTEVPGLRVRLFLDIRRGWKDTTAASELVWKFNTHFRTAEWPGSRFPELYYDPRSLEENQDERSSLHAKCIVVDRRTAFVTSANFTEAAQTRNIEVGALIRSPVFAEELQQHFERLLMSGQLAAVPGGA
jgi:phosphatidylserine/phosphatidylglycerophosphate/cardiolipin synthase-like enzyme